jgi:hypothetical protein
MVSSTVPRFEARCPPVRDMTSVMKGRISPASSTIGQTEFLEILG